VRQTTRAVQLALLGASRRRFAVDAVPAQ